MLSVFLTLIGLGALAILPISQYPEIVPPTVQMLSSQSTGDGKLTVTVTFRMGTDLNVAQMLAQNRAVFRPH